MRDKINLTVSIAYESDNHYDYLNGIVQMIRRGEYRLALVDSVGQAINTVQRVHTHVDSINVDPCDACMQAQMMHTLTFGLSDKRTDEVSTS